MKDLVIQSFTLKGEKVFKHPGTGAEYYDLPTPGAITLVYQALSLAGDLSPHADIELPEEKMADGLHVFLTLKSQDYGDIPMHFKIQHVIGG